MNIRVASHSYTHADSSLLEVTIEFLCLSVAVVQFLFTAFTRLFYKKCNRLKTRVIIYVPIIESLFWLLSPEPAVVDKPQSTRVKEPTLLCNQVAASAGQPRHLLVRSTVRLAPRGFVLMRI